MAKYPGTLLPRLNDPKDSRESRKAVLDLLKKINDTNTNFDTDIETLTEDVAYAEANGRNFKNTIINGDFQIWQRGGSFTGVTTNTYGPDRFKYVPMGAGVVSLLQSTDTPESTSLWSLQVDVTTADTSIAAGDYYFIEYGVEGYDARRYIGKTFTLFFWVKSPKSGVHCVAFRNSATDRTYVSEYTVTSPNTWEKKSITVTDGLITTGTWDWVNGLGVYIDFSLAVGSSLQTIPNAWQSSNAIATANQVNCLDSTLNDFYLSQVQLELGATATEFERKPYGLELELCQRYFRVVSMTQVGGTVYYSMVRSAAGNNVYEWSSILSPSMRTQISFGAGISYTVLVVGQEVLKQFIRFDTIAVFNAIVLTGDMFSNLYISIEPTNNDVTANAMFIYGIKVLLDADF